MLATILGVYFCPNNYHDLRQKTPENHLEKANTRRISDIGRVIDFTK
jgi:hypothetical protein